MFLSEMAEAKQSVIEIRDFDGGAIEDLVKFVYSSRLTLTVDNVQPLLYAACILQVELVARACCEYMKLHCHPSTAWHDLNIENEKQVYNAAIEWLLANPQHHSKRLDETLAQVVKVDLVTLFAVLNAILSTKTVGSLDQK
uniref:Uncharacterized protein n=1 Tax=Molossus molossus TaxID=27622 RepID=A0A7J8I136_MOLMO|nr:hypothetical protein HJG59_010788 [Molossus molossus]